jgi:hypothetical protein
MDDYPKVIHVGIPVTVGSAEEEARWRAVPDAPIEPDEIVEPSGDPLASVSIEMDNPAYQEPVKKKSKKKS